MRNTPTSRTYTVFPNKYIYNLLGGHLFGTKSIPIKRFTPKVSQWTGLYLKQTQAD